MPASVPMFRAGVTPGFAPGDGDSYLGRTGFDFRFTALLVAVILALVL